jgi:hypothetical protein
MCYTKRNSNKLKFEYIITYTPNIAVRFEAWQFWVQISAWKRTFEINIFRDFPQLPPTNMCHNCGGNYFLCEFWYSLRTTECCILDENNGLIVQDNVTVPNRLKYTRQINIKIKIQSELYIIQLLFQLN